MEKDAIKIAVIIPVYNTPASFLKESIDSILNQDCTGLHYNLRTFIHDDGSSLPEIAEVLQQYLFSSSKYVKILDLRYIIHPKLLNAVEEKADICRN